MELTKWNVCEHAEMLAWCLMPNHFHFMLYGDERVSVLKKHGGLFLDPVTNGFRKLLSTYAHEFNIQHNRSGALFRPKTKSKCLSEQSNLANNNVCTDYYSNCFMYIHQNPVNAGIVKSAAEWQWSSYNEYFGKSTKAICNKTLALKYCQIMNEEADMKLIDYVRF